MSSPFNDVYQGKLMILRMFYFEFALDNVFDHSGGKIIFIIPVYWQLIFYFWAKFIDRRI